MRKEDSPLDSYPFPKRILLNSAWYASELPISRRTLFKGAVLTAGLTLSGIAIKNFPLLASTEQKSDPFLLEKGQSAFFQNVAFRNVSSFFRVKIDEKKITAFLEKEKIQFPFRAGILFADNNNDVPLSPPPFNFYKIFNLSNLPSLLRKNPGNKNRLLEKESIYASAAIANFLIFFSQKQDYFSKLIREEAIPKLAIPTEFNDEYNKTEGKLAKGFEANKDSVFVFFQPKF